MLESGLLFITQIKGNTRSYSLSVTLANKVVN